MMNLITRLRLGTGMIMGAFLMAPVMGVMYLTDKLVDLPFVPYDLFDWITRVLPGPLLTFGIDLMIDTMRLLNLSVANTAKTAEQAAAILQFLFLGVAAVAVYFAVQSLRKTDSDLVSGLVLGALVGLPLASISAGIGQSTVNPVVNVAWLMVLFLAWGAAVSYTYRRLRLADAEPPAVEPETRVAKTIGRRQFLITLGAANATITVLGGTVGELLARSDRRRLEEELAASMAHKSDGSPRSPFPNTFDPVVPVPVTRPEYTPVKDHYKVFIRVEPTIIDGSNYQLPITGLVDNPLMLSLDEIREKYESQSHYVTLSCISGRLGTDLISTTQWTGISMQQILDDSGVQSDARYLHIRSGDGFYETVPLKEIAADERIMLTYAWDGNTLPVNHGFPLRIWRPGRHGMKQPKWITSMELLSGYKQGYWVERGWDEMAKVQTVSVVDTVAVDAVFERGGQQFVPVGGISSVEVRVDGGQWNPTELRSPLSETTWVIWRYEWPFEAGQHIFQVRATDGDGTPQIEEFRENRPSGATGLHTKTTTLQAPASSGT